MTDPELVVTYTPARGPPRRVRYESEGDGYVRIEQAWTGCRWREIGSEPVADVAVSPERQGNHDTILGP